ncbi:MAG: 3-deoxy-7-phosphoheptulonate synthase AroG [Vulcanimicrobiaceae bacterium]
MTISQTDDLRIRELKELSTPAELLHDLPASERVAEVVATSRRAAHTILHGHDDRLLVVIGPCSIHDPVAAREYAGRLVAERARLGDALEIVMRVYFEKPRTTVGWKGLINDPALDGSYEINRGLRVARELLLAIAELGLPAGCEFLDTITPQYVADLVSWGAIGARTTESQVHRELASGLSCPVGFKNGTDGNIKIALDAIAAANHAHHFLSVTKEGRSAIVATTGNDDAHLILRGGTAPNYDAASVATVTHALRAARVATGIMIDASHGNSSKQHANQIPVARDIAAQVAAGDRTIAGVMIESHLVAGRQDLAPGRELTYGQSITDACIAWPDSVDVLDALADAVRARRSR